MLGCGVDVFDIDRLDRDLAARGADLLDEVFSASERTRLDTGRRPVARFAAAFAAKEAVFKALGTGKVGRMAWHDIDVSWDACGRAAVTLSGATAAAAAEIGVGAVHLSIALTQGRAVAWVMMTGVGEP
jgi:holo-[acyl-carrier protein] synthase